MTKRCLLPLILGLFLIATKQSSTTSTSTIQSSANSMNEWLLRLTQRNQTAHTIDSSSSSSNINIDSNSKASPVLESVRSGSLISRFANLNNKSFQTDLTTISKLTQFRSVDDKFYEHKQQPPPKQQLQHQQQQQQQQQQQPFQEDEFDLHQFQAEDLKDIKELIEYIEAKNYSHYFTKSILNQTVNTSSKIMELKLGPSSGASSGSGSGSGSGGISLQTRRIVTEISIYLTTLICLAGIVGNILSLKVFCSTKLPRTSSRTYLIALTITDCVFLVAHFIDDTCKQIVEHFRLEFPINITDQKVSMCRAFALIRSTCRSASPWIIVAFTLERFLVVNYPQHSNIISKPLLAKRFVFCIIGVSILISLYAPILSSVYTQPPTSAQLKKANNTLYQHIHKLKLQLFTSSQALHEPGQAHQLAQQYRQVAQTYYNYQQLLHLYEQYHKRGDELSVRQNQDVNRHFQQVRSQYERYTINTKLIYGPPPPPSPPTASPPSRHQQMPQLSSSFSPSGGGISAAIYRRRTPLSATGIGVAGGSAAATAATSPALKIVDISMFRQTCDILNDYRSIYLYFTLFYTIVIIIFPLVIVSVFNTLLIRKLYKSTDQWTSAKLELHEQEMSYKELRDKKVQIENMKITWTLVIISLTFICLTLPHVIVYFLFSIRPNKNSPITIVQKITELFYLFNHSINFFLYVVTRNSFRRVLREKLKCDCFDSKKFVNTKSNIYLGGSGGGSGGGGGNRIPFPSYGYSQYNVGANNINMTNNNKNSQFSNQRPKEKRAAIAAAATAVAAAAPAGTAKSESPMNNDDFNEISSIRTSKFSSLPASANTFEMKSLSARAMAVDTKSNAAKAQQQQQQGADAINDYETYWQTMPPDPPKSDSSKFPLRPSSASSISNSRLINVNKNSGKR